MATMLEGLDATSSPFVTFLDADDLWHPEFSKDMFRHTCPKGERQRYRAPTSHLSMRKERSCLAESLISWTATPGSHTAISSSRKRCGDGHPVFIAPSNAPIGWSLVRHFRNDVPAHRPRHSSAGSPGAHPLLRGWLSRKGSSYARRHRSNQRSLGCYRLHGENAFSRNVLYGSRTSLGQTPNDILIAFQEELIRCLCDNAEPLMTTLPRQYLANVLVALAGREGAVALARQPSRQTDPVRPTTRAPRQAAKATSCDASRLGSTLRSANLQHEPLLAVRTSLVLRPALHAMSQRKLRHIPSAVDCVLSVDVVAIRDPPEFHAWR